MKDKRPRRYQTHFFTETTVERSRVFSEADYPGGTPELDEAATRWHREEKSRILDQIVRKLGFYRLSPELIARIMRTGLEMDAARYYLDYDTPEQKLLMQVDTEVTEVQPGGYDPNRRQKPAWLYRFTVRTKYL